MLECAVEHNRYNDNSYIEENEILIRVTVQTSTGTRSETNSKVVAKVYREMQAVYFTIDLSKNAREDDHCITYDLDHLYLNFYFVVYFFAKMLRLGLFL